MTSSQDDEYQAAYIFSPEDGGVAASSRPPKKRKVAQRESRKVVDIPLDSVLVPLFNGAEKPECVQLRTELFEQAWSVIDSRIQHVLREANRNTLDEVGVFIRGAAETPDKIPAALIITGPNIASQELLFEQLSESLRDVAGERFVRLRSAEAPNLKATLKKIIRDVTARPFGDDNDAEISIGQDGRKYLDYDLEAIYAFLKPHSSRRVVVAFQDSEGFDSGLLSDLIALFSSWRDRIDFSLLFGVATSIELLQARLLKSTSQRLYGAQFDVVQATSIIESIFQRAVAASDIKIRLGPGLLHSLVERQQEQVAGMQAFVSSLKYAYMCHFFANPLSVIALGSDSYAALLQPEHLEAVRSLPSFKAHVEGAVKARQLRHARSMLEDDEYLISQIKEQRDRGTLEHRRLLQTLHLIIAADSSATSFTELYLDAIANGIRISPNNSALVDSMRSMSAKEVLAMIGRLLEAISAGSSDLDLKFTETEQEELILPLTEMVDELEALITRAAENGSVLRSKYSAQSRVLRTTVVAQKVQLSHDTAKLTDEDKAFTALLDRLAEFFSTNLFCERLQNIFLHEAWLYDARTPYRDVFIPRPGTVIERALSKPHDYLNCKCCSNVNGEIASSLPVTAILYHLYLETGSLINVADLWSAFYNLVGDESNDSGYDERTALVLFYVALAELRSLGFVKPSRKKADHVAKVKWL